MKKILLLLLVLIFLLALFLYFGRQAPEIPPATKSAQLLEMGHYKVLKHKLELVDKTRKLDANGSFEGSSERALDVFVWMPEARDAGLQPLIIYSHGFMSDGQDAEHLAELLASHGYTVASATYPLTNYAAPGGANPADIVNQPQDISFIIDTLLARNSMQGDEFHQRIDPQRIAAVGMSLGGMTSKIAAYHPLEADPRIALAVSIAGPSFMFSERFFEGRDIPFMMVASPSDSLINFQDNATDIGNRIKGAVLVSVENGSHIGFSGGSKWLRWMDNPDSLGCSTMIKPAATENESEWYEKIGSAEIGVRPGLSPVMCNIQPLPDTMNPLRQLQITRLAVTSFLRCHFSSDQKTQAESCLYLKSGFAQEIPEVSVSF